jgi:hypothetical protein
MSVSKDGFNAPQTDGVGAYPAVFARPLVAPLDFDLAKAGANAGNIKAANGCGVKVHDAAFA